MKPLRRLYRWAALYPDVWAAIAMSTLAILLLLWVTGSVGCRATGVDAGDAIDTRSESSIDDSPGSWSWNWTMPTPSPTTGAASIAGLAVMGWARSKWTAHRYRQAVDRAVCGIERCGADCSAKEHLKHYRDAVEGVIHQRVVKLTKGGA